MALQPKKEGKDSFEEDNWQYLEKLPPPERLLSVELELKRQIEAISNEGKALSNEARTLIEEHGLEGSIVQYKHVKNHILDKWQNLTKNPLSAVDSVWKSYVKKNGPSNLYECHQLNKLLTLISPKIFELYNKY